MRFYRTLPGGSTLDITSFFMNRSLVSRMLILGLPLLTVVLLLIFVATGSSIENIVNRAIARNAQLQAQGMTLIVSSHILSELDEYCTHILSIRNGRIESHEALQASNTLAQATAGGMAGEATEPLMLYALEIAPQPGAEFEANLRQELQGTTVQDFDATGSRPIQLWLPASATARAAWLGRLVQAGIPVAALAPMRERLQDLYARTTTQARKEQP